MDKVIIAPDPFDDSFTLVKSLPGLHELGVKKCLILQCINSRGLKSAELSFITPVFESNLRDQQKLLEEQGYQVETRLINGLAKHEINRVAVGEDYPLIIVGARQHSLTSETFWGGVAYEVIHSAKKPVLIVRMADDPGGETNCNEERFSELHSHVLFPTDFSENAENAFEHLLKIIDTRFEKLTLIHIQDKIRINKQLCNQLREFNKIDNERLKQLRQRILERAAVKVQTVVKYGSPSSELLKYIQECQVSLVVMGSQGRGFIEEVFLGSVSHNIARLSTASVLLIPADRGSQGDAEIS